MTKSVLGIIGGSGIYDLPGLQHVGEKRIPSPWGEPSAPCGSATSTACRWCFLPRHDKGHRLSPSDINYRAKIDVLQRAGVTDLVSLSACGSFKEELPPGTFVLVDQFIDRTHKRESSFFGRAGGARVDGAPGIAAVSARFGEAASWRPSSQIRRHLRLHGGPAVFLAGRKPDLHKQHGYSVIGMTNMPEAKLAREAEICYATVAMVTDFDCWHPDHDAVTVQDIITVLTQNAENAKRLVARLAHDFPREHEPCPIGSDRALDNALITAPDARDPALIKSSTRWRAGCSIAERRALAGPAPRL